MDYISLKEATKYCNYSQDYLKLRARQGKLKAVKIGRNWVTTREWVEEYQNCGRQAPAVQFSVHPLFSHSNFQFLNIFIKFVLGLTIILTVILIITGVWVNLDVFAEYFQWQTANLSGVFDEVLEIIPGKVIEVK